MHKPVCVVTGVGPEGGTGAEIAKRFSEDGYQVAMLARNADNLSALAAKYENTRAYPCDVADLDALTGIITDKERNGCTQDRSPQRTALNARQHSGDGSGRPGEKLSRQYHRLALPRP